MASEVDAIAGEIAPPEEQKGPSDSLGPFLDGSPAAPSSEVEAARGPCTLAILVATPLGCLRLGLARFARLLIESLATHVLEHSGADHPTPELLQSPIEAIRFRQFNLDHDYPFLWSSTRPTQGQDGEQSIQSTSSSAPDQRL